MNVYILLVVIIVFILSFSYIIFSYRTTSIKMAEELALSKANDIANRTELYLKESLQIARTIRNTFVSLKKGNKATPQDLSSVLIQVLKENDHILSSWVVIDPGHYNSEEFTTKYSKFYEKSGGLSITWFKANGEIILGEPETDTNADFYTIPKNTKKEALLNPYKYKYTNDSKEFFETTVVVPILENGEMIGIVGLDIDLKELQKINSQTKLYETGYSVIIANDYR